MHFDDDWMIITSLTHSLLFFFFSNTKHKLLLRTYVDVGLHDGWMVQNAVRSAGTHLEPYHQRCEADEPDCQKRLYEAAGNDRVDLDL